MISPQYIKELDENQLNQLHQEIEFQLNYGYFERNQFNRALLFKKKEKITSINDIRPLQIIPITVKIIEKCILNQLDVARIIHPNQRGFSPNRST